MKGASPFASAPGAALLRDRLAGGDRRSIGRADEVAAAMQAQPALFGPVFALLFDEDAVVRMRAADVVEKVTVHAPELLGPCKAEFLERLPDIEQQEVRWHAALILPRFDLTREERDTVAIPVLRDYLRDRSRIVQTFALQGLADFAERDAQLRPEVVGLVEAAIQTGSAATKSRARHLLGQLGVTIRPPTGGGPARSRRQPSPAR